MHTPHSHILLVEDSAEHAQILKAILNKLGATIVHCDTAEKAVELFTAKEEFNLLLIDVMLPGMTGFELIQKVREKKIQTPVIFITGNASQADVTQGVLLGAIGYIKKPFNPQLVNDRIKAALKSKKG